MQGEHLASASCLMTLTARSLTLGLMGLDELHLRVLSTSSDNMQERENAAKGMCISPAI